MFDFDRGSLEQVKIKCRYAIPKSNDNNKMSPNLSSLIRYAHIKQNVKRFSLKMKVKVKNYKKQPCDIYLLIYLITVIIIS